jgi:hypothetical protein
MTAPTVPAPADSGGKTRRGERPAPVKWRGPMRPYDLVKEFTVALVVVALLATALAVLFSSPDEKNVTLQQWAKDNPSDFVTTATGELAGTTTSAGYGAPYNTNGDGQAIGPLKLQKWAGVRIPVDPPNDFVVTPLTTVTGDSALSDALTQWKGATADQQTKWATAYSDAIGKAPDGDPTKVTASPDYGPVPVMTNGLEQLATSGRLDSQLVASSGFFQTDYTKPLLFLGDSGYLDDFAAGQHLQGGQWGMMNETGNFPGQAWLWLYSFWYQVPGFTDPNSTLGMNADALIWALMMLLTLILILVPFIPGLRSIPKWIPLYRRIWRDYYRTHPTGS